VYDRTSVRTLAASTLLVLASLGTNVYADFVIEIDEALAAQVQQ